MPPGESRFSELDECEMLYMVDPEIAIATDLSMPCTTIIDETHGYVLLLSSSDAPIQVAFADHNKCA